MGGIYLNQKYYILQLFHYKNDLLDEIKLISIISYIFQNPISVIDSENT